ncbi:MAG: hypothetical protein IT292_08955 [Deltaproteobacteria bacterium]|nr:hypothetical protein [Deltaproteobacteria bacterium]
MGINQEDKREYLRLASVAENYQFSAFYTRLVAEIAAQQSVRKISSLVVLNRMPVFIDKARQRALIHLPMDILIWNEHLARAFAPLPEYLEKRFHLKSILLEIP